MRKLIVILTSTLTFTLLTTTTFGQMIQITCLNGEEVCQGYTTENQAQFQVVSGLPMQKPEKTYVTYTWMCSHANGTKTWDSNQINRRVPIPWSGEYTVQVVARYTREGERRPYAAFWSNKVKVVGKVCTP